MSSFCKIMLVILFGISVFDIYEACQFHTFESYILIFIIICLFVAGFALIFSLVLIDRQEDSFYFDDDDNDIRENWLDDRRK